MYVLHMNTGDAYMLIGPDLRWRAESQDAAAMYQEQHECSMREAVRAAIDARELCDGAHVVHMHTSPTRTI